MRRLRQQRPVTVEEELLALAQRLRFWIVGGTLTGGGFVALGGFLGWQKLHPAEAHPPWLAELGVEWMVALAFGVVVWVHALDVWRDRTTILRIVTKLGTRSREEPP